MSQQARFTHMQDGTQEDWAIIAADFSAYARQLPKRIMAHLTLLEFELVEFMRARALGERPPSPQRVDQALLRLSGFEP